MATATHSRSPSPSPSTSSASRALHPPPKLPLPPLPGSRLSFDPRQANHVMRPVSPASQATTIEDDEHYSHDSSPASTSPSSLTPTLPVTPRLHEDKQLAFPQSPSRPAAPPPTTACPFPSIKRNPDRTPFGRRAEHDDRLEREQEGRREGESESESESGSDEGDDCGCGTPPAGYDDDDDDLDVLDFVFRDQQLARKTPAFPTGPRQAGETGLGLFKRPGMEGLSLEPAVAPRPQSSGQGVPPVLSPPSITLRRPSTAPATTAPPKSSPSPSPRSSSPRTRTRTISTIVHKLRLPKPSSSESDDTSTDEEARDSDETAAERIQRKRRAAKHKKKFDRFLMPTEEELEQARQCELVGETGVKVTLDDLIKQRGRVVFVALRHFWCNLCQQYVQALRETMLSLVAFQNSTENLSSTASSVSVGDYHEPRAIIPPLYIVLVSTGSYKLIPTYRQRLDCPFPLYVDRSRTLYKTLGMTKSSLSMGKEDAKGSYIKNSNWENMVNSTMNGIAMPRYPGPQAQLGGEFVFTYNKETDSVSCEYASRMHTTRAHAEIRELFAAAGVHLNDDDAESVYGQSVHSHLS
ncbi:peroxiredoxin-like family protein [Sporobolomyces koalae]|uniref:peroxiredoxin-like family protein n=1 Tax=Sporobolomyces koalae TaxID=500713 RepID=UPI00316F7185